MAKQPPHLASGVAVVDVVLGERQNANGTCAALLFKHRLHIAGRQAVARLDRSLLLVLGGVRALAVFATNAVHACFAPRCVAVR